MDIQYHVNKTVSVEQFRDVLNNSGLGERRPVEDSACLEGMLSNANLIVSAWENDTLIGIARSVTDFHYACYLSDLAVDQSKQSHGIGKQLQQLTREQLGPRCKLILVAAPAANEYYKKLGYENNPRCWILSP